MQKESMVCIRLQLNLHIRPPYEPIVFYTPAPLRA